MPLISQDMQIAQMEIDSRLKKALWVIEKNCSGIFLPEMAFSGSIIGNLKKFGYRWTLIDDEVFRIQYNNYVPFSEIVCFGDFSFLMRSNYWSNQIASGRFDFRCIRQKMDSDIPQWVERETNRLKIETETPAWTREKNIYLILAMDAETFGHHHKDLIERFLSPMLEAWGESGSGILMPLEEILRNFPSWHPAGAVLDTTWATTEDDARKGDFYPLWNFRLNSHHKNLWQLVNIALRYMNKPGASWDCMKMVSSCHFWWISRARWNPEFMKIGAIKAMNIASRFGSKEEKEEAKEIFGKLMELK